VQKAFDCKPVRVPAKRLEPLVWEEIEKLLTGPGFSGEVIERAKSQLKGSDTQTQLKKCQGRIRDLEQQIETLAERLASLPKAISPNPVYKQMEKLEAIKRDEIGRLDLLKRTDILQDPPMELEDYQAFLKSIQALRDEPNAGFGKAKVVRALVQKVGITKDGAKVYLKVGSKELKRGPANTGPLAFSEQSLFRGSQRLTNGGGCPGTNELVQPPTVRLEYHERWIRKKIDLLELVTLRESGLTMRELAVRFGVSKTTLLRALYRKTRTWK